MSSTPLACHPHDHSHCIASALAAAEAICSREGARLTTLRRRVLELVWSSHQPLGAYDILGVLSREDGRRAAPPTVYRALDFLLEHGLIHRLASLNAFTGCSHPGESHQGYFLLCRQCKTAIEMSQPAIGAAIRQAADALGFTVEGQMVEVVGLCARCQAGEAHANHA